MGSRLWPAARRPAWSQERPGRVASQEVDSARCCNWPSLNPLFAYMHTVQVGAAAGFAQAHRARWALRRSFRQRLSHECCFGPYTGLQPQSGPQFQVRQAILSSESRLSRSATSAQQCRVTASLGQMSLENSTQIDYIQS